MMIINAPDNLLQVQCYKCKVVFNVHPMANMNADWIINCELHKKQHAAYLQDNCRHGLHDSSCIKCGKLYK